jgi:hypothetical protein
MLLAYIPSKRFLSFKLTGLTALLIATFSPVVLAELPPFAYQQMQQQATEVLMIKVRKLQTQTQVQGERKLIDVDAETQVEQVKRSQTGLKPGNIIRIRYEHTQYKNPMPGPGQVPILQLGQVSPAYLRQRGKDYVPVAGTYSFQEAK